MLFNSTNFIFLFLPLFVGTFYLANSVSPKLTILVIGGFSVIFYWNGGANNVLIPVGSILFNYGVAYIWEKLDNEHSRKILISLGVAGNLLLLVYFKYTNFFVGEALAIFDRKFDALEIILPLAISFFTFQQISFLLDLQGRKITRPQFFEYFAYVSFFPQLIAGPIVRFGEIHNQFVRASSSRRLDRIWSNLSIGLSIFAFGLIKKVVLADTMAQFADPVFDLAGNGGILTTPDAWIGMTAFSFQLYFDFSGYSDMAVGLARMVGFRLPINFNSPFKGRDIGDFWRRWHITLTRVVTDYLYTPLSLTLTRKAVVWKLNAGLIALLGVAVPIVITFALLGLWHGAGWNFLIFGLIHAALLILLQIWIKARTLTKLPPLPNMLSSLLTFFCVAISFVMFRSDSIASALAVYKALFAWGGLSVPEALATLLKLPPAAIEKLGITVVQSSVWQGTNAVVWITLCAVIAFATPNVYEIMRRYRPAAYKDWMPERRQRTDQRILGNVPAPTGWPMILLVCVAASLCVLAFFQGVGVIEEAVSTTFSTGAAVLVLLFAVWQIGKPARLVMWRQTTAWLLVTSLMLTIGILDVFTDQGIEFVYFEF